MANKAVINNIGFVLSSIIEDKHYYDLEKDDYERFYLTDPNVPDEHKIPFPEYSVENSLSAALEGLMRNWGIPHEETGLYFEPLINEYIGDIPVDFGLRVTKKF